MDQLESGRKIEVSIMDHELGCAANIWNLETRVSSAAVRFKGVGLSDGRKEQIGCMN